jgi:hypothetical protein
MQGAMNMRLDRPQHWLWLAAKRCVLPAALIAAFILAVPVRATPATTVTITTHVDFSGPTAQGTFIASPPLCASGSFIDDVLSIIGSGQPPVFTALVRRTFTCADGSGTFALQVSVKFPREATGSVEWSVFSGIGAYTALHGTGRVSFASTGPLTGMDNFSGAVHFD